MKKTQKVLDCIAFIESQNMTCDELSRLLSEVEDLKGSDYEPEFNGWIHPSEIDMTDDLREQNGEFDRH